MADVSATAKIATPSTGYCSAYVTGAKAAQNDTLTVSNFKKIVNAQGMVEPSSGNWVEESCERVDGTLNQVKLTATTVGTSHLWIQGIPV